MTAGERLAIHGLALPAGHVLETVDDRPDLARAMSFLGASVWPEFMLHDAVVDANWHHLWEDWAGTQACLLDPAGEMVAVLHASPLRWDGTDEGLPMAGTTSWSGPSPGWSRGRRRPTRWAP